MSQEKVYTPNPSLSSKAHIQSLQQYTDMYNRSVEEPEQFWGELAKDFFWKEPWTQVRDFDFENKISIQWFKNGKTNLCFNALDVQIEKGLGEKKAILWEGNEPGEEKSFTYQQVLDEVCKTTHALKKLGVRKGNRVAIYMPMVPELAFAMLACARMGAIHTIVFGGFSAESLADRILDAKCEVLITADGCMRGTKPIALKNIADHALDLCEQHGHKVNHCLVLNHSNGKISCALKNGRDQDWQTLVSGQPPIIDPEWMDAEDPLFILYTSGSTGKPKGVLHTTGGYMVYAATTFKYVFDHKPEDIYWCTADIGWITGHSYIVYGPLCNGATTVMFEGIPTYPDAGRFWQICEKLKITTFYTAPTAIRALERFGNGFVNKHNLDSLRILGSVGEPLNFDAWLWYHKIVGKEQCPIVDTWWQTETGGILISPLPGATPLKPTKATLPFFGVKPEVVNEKGKVLDGPCEGILAIAEPWPGMMRTLYGDHQRFKETYFSIFPGKYFTGDGCTRDEDGYYRITGRVDDVINVSGHRIGTAEIEDALNSHPAVVESAVTGFPHKIKGQGIYAYLTILPNVAFDKTLKTDIEKHVRQVIGSVAVPDVLHEAPALPKTRSGKIMRRILRKIASDELETLGDTSTLADPSVVKNLVQNRPQLDENKD